MSRISNITVTNTNTSLGLPVIHYSALIGTPNNEDTDVEHNDTLDNMVDITSTGDFRPFEQSTGNRSKVSIRVSKLQLTALTKASDQPFWDPGDTMGYTMSIGNNGSTVYRNTFIMDTLPSDGDALGSSFDGPLVVDGLTFDPSTASNVGSFRKMAFRFGMELSSKFSHTLSPTKSNEAAERSEERRVGKECRSRWSPYH